MIEYNEEFWVAVSFGLFIFAIFKPVKHFLLSALDKRILEIQSELDEAVRLREEAQEVLASYERRQAEIEKEAQEIIAHAESESKRLVSQAKLDLKEALETRTNLALQKIASYEESVLQQVRMNAVDIAVGAVRSLVVENMSPEVAQDLVNRAVQNLGRKVH